MDKRESLLRDPMAEMALVGGLCRQPEKINDYRALLSNGAFTDKLNNLVLGALIRISDRGAIEDLQRDALRAIGRELVGNKELIPHVAEMFRLGKPDTDIEYYASVVQENHQLRRLISLCEELARRARSGKHESSALRIEAYELLSKIPVQVDRYEGRTLKEVRELWGSITWLWPDWIQSEGLTIIAGPSGSGKTTLALWLAVGCAIQGRRWPDGSEAQARPGKRVLWLDAEGALSQIGELVRNYQLPENSLIFPRGPTPDVVETVQLTNSQWWTEIESLFSQKDVGIMVLDSVHSALAGVDKNRSELVEPSLQRFRAMSVRRHKPIAIIAHTKKIGDARLKQGSFLDAGISPLELLSGSSGIGFAADSVLGVLPLNDGKFRLAAWKMRNAPKPRMLDGEFCPGDSEILFAPSPETKADHAQEVKAADWILTTLTSYGGRITASSIRGLAETHDIKRRTFYRAADRLIKQDKIYRESGHWFLGKK